MKKLLPLVILISGICVIGLSGCGAPAEESESGTKTEQGAEKAEEESKEESRLPADVIVASDGTVRNGAGKAYCTVMNEVVEGDEASLPHVERDGVKYIFCCKSCPGTFAKNPEKYLVAKK